MNDYLVLAGVILTFLTALTGWLKSRQNGEKIAEVHVLVNAQLTAVVARVGQLVATLETAGVPVPPDPGGPATGEPPGS
jgi:hypothetical protein